MRLSILAFAAGVLLLQRQAALPPEAAWGAVAVLPALAALWRLPRIAGKPQRLVQLLAALLFLGAGLGWAAWRAELRLAETLDPAWEGRDVELIGVVAALPQNFPRGTRFEFDVESIATPGAATPTHLMLSWYSGRGDETAPALRAGERWRLTVRLKRPHGNANPKGFDYEAWLLERNIRATGYVRPGGSLRLEAQVVRPGYVVERLRQIVRDRFLSTLPAPDYPWTGILVALAVGDQGAIPGDLWNTFNRTGVTHLMSISGLHVTLLAGLCGALLGSLWRRSPWLAERFAAQRAAVIGGWAAACFYTALAGFGVPAQRTLYMLSAAALALLAGRATAPSRVLAFALFVVLLIDPWAVLAAGFWLSFGAVAALLYVGAAQTIKPPGWRGRLREWGLTQWVATLASLPILLLVFQQFSLISPLANALAIPLISFVVTPLALLAALFPWAPLLELAHAALDLLMAFLAACAAAPVWNAPAPPAWSVVAAGAGIAWMLLPRGLPGRLAGSFLLLPIIFWPGEPVPEGTAQLTLLDVGEGLAVVVRTREHTLVYDPGPLYNAESDAGQRILVPYLKSLGVDRLDKLIITHQDSDHSGGEASVRAALPVLASLGSASGEPCLAGQNWTWDGVHFLILHPAEDAPKTGKANHLACVLRVETPGGAALLTSDIEAEDEAALLARDPAALAAKVVQVPHHGSRSSSTPAFIAATGAQEAIVPVGYRNRFGHPKPEVLARYEAHGMRLWRTDRDGAIRVLLTPDGYGIESWREQERRYWFE